MRLIGLAMVKNERDVIESFVRHNLQFLDAIFIIDNSSSDGTREILENLLKEGKPLVIFDWPKLAFFQADQITKLCRNICRFFTFDFAFILDADEFIKASSREFLENYLTFLPPDHCGVIPWHTYVLNANDDNSILNPTDRIRHRCKQEYPQYYKCLIPRSVINRDHYVINEGNHFVFGTDGNMLPHGVMNEISIAHYPVRTPNQITQKVLNGWLGYLARDPDSKKNIYGFFWYRIYQRLMQNPILSMEETIEISLGYSQMNPPPEISPWDNFILDPLDTRFDLRYTPDHNLHPSIAIVKNIEAFFINQASFELSINHLQVDYQTNTNLSINPESKSANKPDQIQLENTRQKRLSHQPYIDLPPFKYLFNKYSPQSLLDIGCQLGENLAIFQGCGVADVFGIDACMVDRLYIQPQNYAQSNLIASIDLGRKYDLVMCMNLLGDIPTEYEDIALASCDRHAEHLILFAAPEPGQPGGYINCHPLSYWLARWQALGWQPLAFDTLAFRSLATFISLRRNPILLARTHADSSNVFNLSDLQRLESHAITWLEQAPNTFTYPLSQSLPLIEYDGAAP